ncbi:hypothetical protein DICSQDRAFT_133851 [Dichomitus squalens LYAD-421 SS1]|uniref:Uncharacterized protein n=1 Tax=Dichomitus squalens TaxID=114155 RepID=A0A4Q9MWQ1_9APHY|nr:uncharacterized protein DICSQDRAFT_133851 [Dichomitus squalens LYAD-421 SS1]EJF64184.1 hypothetical protein DICSQDRAFT_133851 [Dichomitus squalens LYAD-421 SS1]TBU30726.1 hypothetical protein BD311DRAFT_827526 [Dichomitus squalens]
MDAVDLNWCLACGCRLEMEGCTPYCSQNCLNSDGPSTSAFPSQQTLPSLIDRDSYLHGDDDDDDDESPNFDDCLAYSQCPSPIRNTWIGRGDAGIRAWAQSVPRGAPCESQETPSGTLKPKLLLQSRRPVKPSLCMSRAQPAPPEPSRPILTPQQSLPSLSRDSTSIPSASLASLTTGSSSYSVVTPATNSEIGSLRNPAVPRPTAPQHNFLGGLKAQLRAWAASSTPQKEVTRSRTLTRNPAVHIADTSDAESGTGRAAPRVRRPRSPAPFFHMPEQYPREKRKETTKENTLPSDHPAYRTRGRRPSRIAS